MPRSMPTSESTTPQIINSAPGKISINSWTYFPSDIGGLQVGSFTAVIRITLTILLAIFRIVGLRREAKRSRFMTTLSDLNMPSSSISDSRESESTRHHDALTTVLSRRGLSLQSVLRGQKNPQRAHRRQGQGSGSASIATGSQDVTQTSGAAHT